jgi:glycosyltransferase involved in cell wall biosynthesis
VIVTFGRPASLARIVDELADAGIDSLTVVDNAPSADSEAAARRGSSRVRSTYIPMPDNVGPAGGFATGMQRVLETAADDDWIFLMDDDRLVAPFDTVQRLREFGAWLLARGAPVGAVGLLGATFDRRFGRLVRPADEDLAGPVTVDYVANGQLLMIRVAAARDVGVFDPDLFFGFEELDYCLRLGRNGYGIYANGPEWLEARRRFGRLGSSVGAPSRRTSAWRRYFSVRNHIVIMRRYTSAPRAMVITIAHLVGRPVSDVLRRRDDVSALALAGTRACFDAWTGRLGRRMEPTATPDAQHASTSDVG